MSNNKVPIAQSAGEVDISFGTSGLCTLRFSGAVRTIAEGMATTPSGQIIVSATVIDAQGKSSYGLARLDAEGHPDLNFGTAGYLTGQFNHDAASQGGQVFVDKHERIWMCGVKSGIATEYQQVIARFNSDGSPDVHFGGTESGYREVPMRIASLFGATGGSLILAKSDPQLAEPDRLLFMISRNGNGLLARFHLDGKDDDTFDGKGWKHLQVPELAITLRGVTQLNDGLIFVNGGLEEIGQGLVMGFDQSGAVAEFGEGGVLRLLIEKDDAPLKSTVNHIIVQSAERLLLIGSAVNAGGVQHAFISGILNNGTFDRDFNAGVPVITAATDALDLRSWRAGFALDDNDGKRIVTVGQTSHGEQRLLTGGFLVDGAVDPAFDVEGTARVEWTAQAACLQNSCVLVLGHKEGAACVVRLLTAAVG
ncbi:NHL repeat-containing protein [Pseudomonas retamae]|uniref:Delta-60 repeat domain-containing protein n=1 Tax=Pseudomonas retamae TaxID=702110 RepID=A0ABW7DAS5_9PSED